MSSRVPVDIKVEVKGPVKGGLTRAIAIIISVGLKYNCFIDAPEYYRVCLGKNSCPGYLKPIEDINRLLDNAVSYRDEVTDYDLYEYIIRLCNMVTNKWNAYSGSYECGRKYDKLVEYPEIGLKVSYGKWTFCLTLYKSHWSIMYEIVKGPDKEYIYLSKPEVEVFGLRLNE